MVSEDFSFPKVPNPSISHLMFSPSLWRVSSVVYPDFFDEENEKVSVDSAKSGDVKTEEKTTTTAAEEEEKMDMLWEDFNEELQMVYCLDKKKDAGRLSSDGLVSGRCVQDMAKFQTDRHSGMMYQPKRQSMLAVVKVLRKMMLLRKLVWNKKDC